MSLIEDFNRIANLPEEGWDHNSQYHGYLLRQLPRKMNLALDVGCGTGRFSRLLAERAESVVAVDISPEMIRIARQRSSGYRNIDYIVADVSKRHYAEESFDAVVSIAALHHLPLRPMLKALSGTLKPGGVLAVLDLVRSEETGLRLWDAMGVTANFILRLAHLGRLSGSPEVQEAWEAHGRSDRLLSINEVRDTCRDVLPGALVRRHILWRYSIVWHKPPLAQIRLETARQETIG